MQTEMTKSIQEVAGRIRMLRDAMGYSVEEMAKATDVSAETYLRYEAGEADFAFTFVYKFAQVCGVEITEIMQGDTPMLHNYCVTRKGKGMPLARNDGFSYSNLAHKFRDKQVEPFHVVMPFSEEGLLPPYHFVSHEGQEIDIVLSGSMKIFLGEHSEILHAGDSIYFDSATPHAQFAVGGEDCEIYAIVVNPERGAPANYVDCESPFATTQTDRALKNPIAARFVTTTTDENGVLSGVSFHNDDRFNFAYDVVDAVAAKTPNKLAMLHIAKDGTERRYTFSDMSRLSAQTANYFRAMGISRGDKVMLVLKRHPHFWLSILALHRIGAVAIPATNLLMEHDFEYRFKAGNVSAIVCTADGDTARQAELASAKAPSMKTMILAGGKRDGWHDFDGEVGAYNMTFPRTEETSGGNDPMLMLFTSGTTGYPKLAAHTYRYALGHYLTAKYWHNVNPDGLHFTISDTGWGKALWGKLYGQWLCEAPVFTYDFDKFNAAEILSLMEKYRVTTFCAPPTMYRMMLREDLRKYDLSALSYATTAGEALNREVYSRFLAQTGVRLMEGFGQTETTLAIANFVGTSSKPGSMGKPSPLYDIDLLDADGNPVPDGDIGEIVIRVGKTTPPGLFAGYYRADGSFEKWNGSVYHTGDSAWRDEDGYIWYVGRVDHVIKSSGYRIGPFEVEDVILRLPYVAECAVTSAPDPIRGQVVKAIVVLTEDKAPSEELVKEIQTFVKTNTAPYKYPRIVEFREELPKTISGKIIRSAL